jgi:hypothetical protein
MTSYETCKACHGREAFGLGPCNKCSHKSSSIVETKSINGVQYYALKQATTTKKPYHVTLMEKFENV